MYKRTMCNKGIARLWFISLNLVALLCIIFLLFIGDNASTYHPQFDRNQNIKERSKEKVLPEDDELRKSNSMRTFKVASHIPRQKIIIYTLYRSGSSFIGDLFANHPDVYYVFEPLQTYPHYNSTDKNKPKEDRNEHISRVGGQFLKQLLSCHMGPFVEDVKKYHVDGNRRLSTWGRRAFCRDYKYGVAFVKSCDPRYVKQVEQKCKTHNTIVIKTIVLHNLTALIPLLEQGVKVVHLVRDPRGQIQSIKSLDNQFNSSKWVPLMCSHLKNDISVSNKIKQMGLSASKNYRVVRYEDVALNPRVISEDLFNFAGLAMRGKVRRWLKKATTTRSRSHWSTMQMSNETAVAWRKTIDFELLDQIQKAFKESMETLGYTIVNSKDDLHDLKKSLLTDILQ